MHTSRADSAAASSRLWLSISLSCVMAGVGSLQAAELLSDVELAIVSAGTGSPVPDPTTDASAVRNVLNGVVVSDLTEQGQPYHPFDDIQTGDIPAIHETLIVDGGSHAQIHRHHPLTLSDATQSRLVGFNLVNSSRSNLINASNVHVSLQALSLNQSNQITQTEFQQAHYASNTPLQLISTASLRAVDQSSQVNSIGTEIQRAHTSRRSSSVSVVDVTVPPFRPEVLFEIADIGTLIPEWSLQIIPAVSFGGIYTDPAGGDWGFVGSYTGLTLTGPTLAVNGLEPRGEDLFLDIDFNLPELNMGTIRATGCVSECSDESIHLGSIGGNSIVDGITLEGMNPLNNLELNINTGIATAGRGSFSASDSSVGISGELTGRIGVYFDFELDLSDHWWVDDAFGQNRWAHREELEYELTIPFSILDFNVDGFSLDFDGAICVALFGNQSCGQSQYAYQAISSLDNSVFSHQTDQSITSGSFNESHVHRVRNGGVLTGATAELIVMTDSSLLLVSDSGLSVNDAAQQTTQAANIVNASATLSANSLNIQLSRPMTINPVGQSGALFNQRNYFNQRL